MDCRRPHHRHQRRTPQSAVINPNAMLANFHSTSSPALSTGGLLIYNRTSRHWSQITTGLPSLNVTAHRRTRNGELYLGTDNGIVHVAGSEAAMNSLRFVAATLLVGLCSSNSSSVNPAFSFPRDKDATRRHHPLARRDDRRQVVIDNGDARVSLTQIFAEPHQPPSKKAPTSSPFPPAATSSDFAVVGRPRPHSRRHPRTQARRRTVRRLPLASHRPRPARSRRAGRLRSQSRLHLHRQDHAHPRLRHQAPRARIPSAAHASIASLQSFVLPLKPTNYRRANRSRTLRDRLRAALRFSRLLDFHLASSTFPLAVEHPRLTHRTQAQWTGQQCCAGRKTSPRRGISIPHSV